jgi:N-acetylglucosamine kinase-like BadF-type ATPase
VEKAAETIYTLIVLCCESVGCTVKDIAGVAMRTRRCGTDGRPEKDGEWIESVSHFEKGLRLKNVIVESDARAALEGAFHGGAGIILIAGTGSIAFGKDRKGECPPCGRMGEDAGR